MLDKISNAYDRLISSYLRRFTPITAPGDWHLRLEWLPCGKPEVVYDIKYMKGTANIILTRFLESAWKKLWAAYREEKAKVSVQVEIGTMELPPEQSILKIVAEGLPRQCQEYPTAALDGEQFRMTLWDKSGKYHVQVWEPYTRTDDFGPWIEIIDAIRGAAGLVQREFVALS